MDKTPPKNAFNIILIGSRLRSYWYIIYIITKAGAMEAINKVILLYLNENKYTKFIVYGSLLMNYKKKDTSIFNYKQAIPSDFL